MPRLNEWTVHEVAFLYALSSITFAITDMVIGQLDQFPQKIRDGNFDILLVRPRGTLFQVIASDFALRRLARVLQGSIVLVYALSTLTIHWTVPRTLVLLVSIPSAIVIFSSIWVVGACIAFWTTDGGEFTNAFTYGGTAMAQYPFDIYATLAAPAPRLRRAAGVRLLLPRALRARQARSARPAAVARLRVSAGRARRGNRGRAHLAVRRPPLPERRRMIEVEELRKQFVVRRGRFRRERRVVDAVNRISFRVDRGELLGYLGPNGAGKSTTIKMLTGILVPTDGHVRVAGLEPSRKRIELARRIGAMFGQRIQLWWDLPLRDSFELLRHIYRVPADRYTRER